tara:strand:+ start:503 stop:1060 length:558 start_codon:yes stop_codon:yes gene_type:complete
MKKVFTLLIFINLVYILLTFLTLIGNDIEVPFYLIAFHKENIGLTFIFGASILLICGYLDRATSKIILNQTNLLLFLSILFFYMSYNEYPSIKMENARDDYYQLNTRVEDWGKCEGCKTSEDYKYYNYTKNKAKIQEDYLRENWQSLKNGIAVNDRELYEYFNFFFGLGMITFLGFLYVKIYKKN